MKFEPATPNYPPRIARMIRGGGRANPQRGGQPAIHCLETKIEKKKKTKTGQKQLSQTLHLLKKIKNCNLSHSLIWQYII